MMQKKEKKNKGRKIHNVTLTRVQNNWKKQYGAF